MHRNDFLAELHKIIKPKIYLEIGVQYGTSLNLAHDADVAIGIDPHPLITASGNQIIHAMRSDDFFAGPVPKLGPIDFAYIDGSHLFEDAASDYLNILNHSHRGTIIAFDDVLPYNAAIAARTQPHGDWTGDVWRVIRWLYSTNVPLVLVDVDPTGLLIVPVMTPLGPPHPGPFEDGDEVPPPDWVISRQHARAPGYALDYVKEFLGDPS